MTARGWLAAVAGLVACSAPAPRRLPGASITPHLELARIRACGVDVALDGHPSPDVRYLYTYDARGRLARAAGTWASGGSDRLDYTWDHLDHLVGLLDTPGSTPAQVEIAADYDTLGDLVDYTWSSTAYRYSGFAEDGQPTREVLAQPGAADVAYDLSYDASGRIVQASQEGEGGATTLYSYDDAATRTVTIDTDHGASLGIVVYDDADRELSESWDGSDPSVIASETRYAWDGDRLLSTTSRSGSYGSPHELRTVEVDTLRYDCRSR